LQRSKFLGPEVREFLREGKKERKKGEGEGGAGNGQAF
jgi:hypothetical protein